MVQHCLQMRIKYSFAHYWKPWNMMRLLICSCCYHQLYFVIYRLSSYFILQCIHCYSRETFCATTHCDVLMVKITFTVIFKSHVYVLGKSTTWWSEEDFRAVFPVLVYDFKFNFFAYFLMLHSFVRHDTVWLFLSHHQLQFGHLLALSMSYSYKSSFSRLPAVCSSNWESKFELIL